MKTSIALVPVLLATLLMAGTATAGPTLVSNPLLPYPPSCGRLPDPSRSLESQAVQFYGAEVDFYDAWTGAQVPMTVSAYRAPCSEPGRSLVWLEFVMSESVARAHVQVRLPIPVAEPRPDWRYPMRLAAEPNGWGASWASYSTSASYMLSRIEGLSWYYGQPIGDRRWVYLLEGGDPADPYDASCCGEFTAADYNEAFRLIFRYPPYDYVEIEVPATRDLLPAEHPELPLSGRLSGHWAIGGARDQGLLLSVSRRVLPAAPGDGTVFGRSLVFLAHYTFDADGAMLWLTGAAELEPGQSRVTIPMERVRNGEFRGARQAEREVIGTVTLRSRSCDHVDFAYDYATLGLGAGERRLQRLFSLEIAGHECRDREARLAAVNGPAP